MALTSGDTDEREISGVARGSGIGIVGTAVSQLSVFAIVAVLAVVRGSSGVGVYSEAFALLTLLSLVGLMGLQTTLTRYVARHLAADEHVQARQVIRLGLQLSVTASVGLAVCVFALASWFGHSVLDEPEIVTPLRFVAVAMPFTVYMRAAASALQGFNNMRDFVGITLILEPTVRLVLTVVGVGVGAGVDGAMAALVLSSVVGAAQARRRLRVFVARGALGAGYDWRGVMRFTLLTWVATLSTNALLWADTLLIGALLTASHVGVYQVATRVVALATAASVPIAAAFAPRIADLIRRQRWAPLEHAYRVTTSWSIRLALPALAVCAVAPDELLRVFGSQFGTGALVTVILVGGKFVECATGPCGMVLNMSNRVGTNALNNVLAVVLNIGLDLWLIPRHGIVGAAIGWSVSLALLNIARVVEVRTLLGLSPYSAALTTSVALVVPGVLVALALHTVVHGVPFLLVAAVVIAVSYAALVRLFAWSPDDVEAVQSLPLPRRRGPAAMPAAASAQPGGSETGDVITIRSLVSPLRYDVLVRADFFRLIERNLDLYRADRPAFIELARRHPYYSWFREIAWPMRGTLRALQNVEAGFRRRVDDSVQLFESFRERGFDARYPIGLRRLPRPVPTDTDKLVDRPYAMGDGCHRLALLLNSGEEVLTPDRYRVMTSVPFAPRDNTHRMLRLTAVDEGEYARFVAWGYDLGAVRDVDELLEAAGGLGPDRAEELRRVVGIDRAGADAGAGSFRAPSPPAYAEGQGA